MQRNHDSVTRSEGGEGRGKREEGRGKREQGRGKRGLVAVEGAIPISTHTYSTRRVHLRLCILPTMHGVEIKAMGQ
jgi:hypothetical protein